MSDTEWPEVTLGDHVDLLSGFAFKSKEFTDDPEAIPLVKGENVHQGFIDWKIAKRWPSTQLEGCEKYFLEPGDVVLAMDRPWIEAGLKWAWIRPEHPKALLVQRVSRMRGLGDLDTRFLRYIIGSHQFTDYIRPIVTGVNVPHISGGQIKGFKFRLPPLPTQCKIAAILSAYDDLIENNTRRIAILEEMAQAIYREWFVNFRFPGHENVKFVDSPLGKIPHSWCEKTLEQVTSKIGSGATPTGGKNAYKDSGITLIRSLNVYDFNFHDDGLAFIDEQQAGQLDNVTVERHDILLNITGASVARCCMVRTDLLPARVNQHVAIIRADTTKADPFFLLSTINSERHKKQILALAQGGATREALTKTTIQKFQILLPDSEIMRRFGTIAEGIFEQREILQRKNQNLRTTRDLLLPKLISGQLDVEDLDIDVGMTAEELAEVAGE